MAGQRNHGMKCMVDDKKTIGMDSADTQNCSEWRGCLQGWKSGFKMMMIMMVMMITLN